jgi:hypothetical protein
VRGRTRRRAALPRGSARAQSLPRAGRTGMIPLLGADPESPFPPLRRALREPDGLLAAGGDLRPARLLKPTATASFPGSRKDNQSCGGPGSALGLRYHGFRLPARFRARCAARAGAERRPRLRRRDARLRAGAARRPGGRHLDRAAMLAAYSELHRLGHAHSVEVWAVERWSAASTAWRSAGCSSARACSARIGRLQGRARGPGARAVRLGLAADRRAGRESRTCSRWAPACCPRANSWRDRRPGRTGGPDRALEPDFGAAPAAGLGG